MNASSYNSDNRIFQTLKYRIYYALKPFLPRYLQIVLRRIRVLRIRKLNKHVWPIDERANKSPEGWVCWPEQKQFALVLMHDVDTARGHQNCYKLMSFEESMGFRSSFNFVPEKYNVSHKLRLDLAKRGFEVGVHGLKHDGKLFLSKRAFVKQAVRINHYLREWQSAGFISPSMIRNLDWIRELAVEYDTSTFDTDPFEPQPEGVSTIFPFWVRENSGQKGFVEIPYTLPQDFTIFVLMKEKDIDIWKKKLDWIVKNGGMALVITHPDYMKFGGGKIGIDEYPAQYYKDFLEYVKYQYEGKYWSALPRDMARFWASNYGTKSGETKETKPSLGKDRLADC